MQRLRAMRRGWPVRRRPMRRRGALRRGPLRGGALRRGPLRRRLRRSSLRRGSGGLRGLQLQLLRVLGIVPVLLAPSLFPQVVMARLDRVRPSRTHGACSGKALVPTS